MLKSQYTFAPPSVPIGFPRNQHASRTPKRTLRFSLFVTFVRKLSIDKTSATSPPLRATGMEDSMI